MVWQCICIEWFSGVTNRIQHTLCLHENWWKWTTCPKVTMFWQLEETITLCVPAWLNEALSNMHWFWVVSIFFFFFYVFSINFYHTKQNHSQESWEFLNFSVIRTPFSMNIWKKRYVLEHLLFDWPIGLHVKYYLWEPKSL